MQPADVDTSTQMSDVLSDKTMPVFVNSCGMQIIRIESYNCYF